MVLPEIRYRFVNWRDGMKITQKHFVEHDNAMRDIVRDSTALSLNNYNYGLVAAEDGISSSLSPPNLTGDVIEITSCRGVTPGGVRFDWKASKEQPALQLSLLDYKSKVGMAGLFYVVIKANPFSISEVGDYDVEENNGRRPFVATTLSLDLLSIHDMLSDVYSFPVCRIRFESQRFSIDHEYLPPCTDIHGEGLLWYYESCGTLMNNIQQTATQIVRKIGGMEKRSSIAVDLHRVLEKQIIFFAESLDYYRIIVRSLPPVYMAEYFMRMARCFRVALDCLPELSSAALFNYFQNTIAGTTNVFKTSVPAASKSYIDALIDNVLVNEYNHNDSTLLFDNIVRLLDFQEFFYQKLLTLNYAGNQGGFDIYIK